MEGKKAGSWEGGVPGGRGVPLMAVPRAEFSLSSSRRLLVRVAQRYQLTYHTNETAHSPVQSLAQARALVESGQLRPTQWKYPHPVGPVITSRASHFSDAWWFTYPSLVLDLHLPSTSFALFILVSACCRSAHLLPSPRSPTTNLLFLKKRPNSPRSRWPFRHSHSTSPCSLPSML